MAGDTFGVGAGDRQGAQVPCAERTDHLLGAAYRMSCRPEFGLPAEINQKADPTLAGKGAGHQFEGDFIFQRSFFLAARTATVASFDGVQSFFQFFLDNATGQQSAPPSPPCQGATAAISSGLTVPLRCTQSPSGYGGVHA
jgi:hypothetical protein